MKDLKHLIYFENLLQDANNELVAKAVNEGRYALGYNCYYIPETLLNLPGCFSSRLRAPRCTSTDVASYYMTTRTCPYARSILERAIEGGYNLPQRSLRRRMLRDDGAYGGALLPHQPRQE